MGLLLQFICNGAKGHNWKLARGACGNGECEVMWEMGVRE